MGLRVSAVVDVVEMFEARLLGDEDETLACTYGEKKNPTALEALRDYGGALKRVDEQAP
jgi:hypothetical protein